MNLIKIGCREIGKRDHRRWIIHNNGNPEEYWTGYGWSIHSAKAKLFQDRNIAYPIAKKLQDIILADLPLRTYTATIQVEVRSDLPVSLANLKDYCHGASSFELDYDLYGNGPKDAQVWAIIDWDSLRKGK